MYDYADYESHREMLLSLYFMVEQSAKKAGHETDWDADDVDAITISVLLEGKYVSVKAEDPEASAVKLTMLTHNGVIVGEASFSNLDMSYAADAVSRYLLGR